MTDLFSHKLHLLTDSQVSHAVTHSSLVSVSISVPQQSSSPSSSPLPLLLLLQIGGEKSDFMGCNQIVAWQLRENRLNASKVEIKPPISANDNSENGQWEILSSLPALDGHSSCRVDHNNGAVLVTGGWHSGDVMRMIRIDIDTESDTSISNDNVTTAVLRSVVTRAAGDNRKHIPLPRVRHTAVYDRTHDRVLIFGGRIVGSAASDPVVCASVFAFDLKEHKWHKLSVSAFSSNTDIPEPRCGHSSVMDERNGRMLVFGGMAIDGNDAWSRYFDDLFAFDTNSHTWSRIDVQSGPRPAPRERHTAVMWQNNQHMLVMGGWTRGHCVHGEQAFMSFDTESNTWKHWNVSAATGSGTAADMARFGHCAAIIDGDKILVLGGRDSGFSILEDAIIYSSNDGNFVAEVQQVPTSHMNTTDDNQNAKSAQIETVELETKASEPPLVQPSDNASVVSQATSTAGAIAERLRNRTRGALLAMERKATLKRPRRSTTTATSSVKDLLNQVENFNTLDTPAEPRDVAFSSPVDVNQESSDDQTAAPDMETKMKKKKPLGGVNIFNMSDMIRSAGGKLKKTKPSGVSEEDTTAATHDDHMPSETSENAAPDVNKKKKKPIGGVAMPGMPDVGAILGVKLRKTKQ